MGYLLHFILGAFSVWWAYESKSDEELQPFGFGIALVVLGLWHYFN